MRWPRQFGEGYFRLNLRDPEYPLAHDGVTELRLHGVSGAPPEALVNDPQPLLLSGDNRAAFFRRTRGPESGRDRGVEAYSWSGINSRSSTRALWLTLFPFGMVNFAGWMIPAESGLRFQRALVRITGLVITLHYMATAMILSVDLLGYQCAREARCLAGRWLFPLRWAHGLIDPTRPIRLLVVLSAVPVLLLGVIFILGRRNPRGYENQDYRERTGIPDPPASGEEGERVDDLRLSNPRFWRAPDVVDVQALVHLAGGIAFVGAALAYSLVLMLDPGAAGRRPLFWLAWGLTAVIGLASTQLVRAGWQRTWGTDYRAWRNAAWGFVAVAALLTIAVGAVAWNLHPRGALRFTNVAGLWRSYGIILIVEILLIVVFLLKGYTRMGFAALLIGILLFHTLVPIEGAVEPRIWHEIDTTWVGGALKDVVEFVVAAGRIWADYTRLEWWGWVLLATTFAIAAWLPYWLRHRPRTGRREKTWDPERHRNNFFWVFAGLVPIAMLGFLAFRKASASGGWIWLAALAASLAVAAGYLLAMFKVQIDRCHDYPPRWKLRGGGPGTVLGLGVGAITMVSVAFIVLLAQALGDDKPLNGDVSRCLITVPEGALRIPEMREPDASVTQEPACTMEPADPDERRLHPSFTLRGEQPSIWYYDDLGWVATAGLAGFLGLVFAFIVRERALALFRFNKSVRDKVRGELASQPNLTEQQLRDLPKAMVAARKWASFVDDADWLLSVAVAALVAALIAVLLGQMIGQLPDEFETAVALSSRLMVALAVAAVFLVRTSYKQGNVRKAVGVLWDVTSFFPRRFHPLAPPCYAERAVPELRDRLVLLTSPHGCGKRGQVLLLAHSQGTLLAYATLQTLLGAESAECLKRIRLVTFGSMLQRLFGRAYGEVVTAADLVRLKNALEGWKVDDLQPGSHTEFGSPGLPPARARWQHFARKTDYLGGRLFVPHYRPPNCGGAEDRFDDVLFDDPPRPGRVRGETEPPTFFRHSFDYVHDEEDPRFQEHVDATLDEMCAAAASEDVKS